MMEEFTWEECLALLDEIEGCGIQTFAVRKCTELPFGRFHNKAVFIVKVHGNAAQNAAVR